MNTPGELERFAEHFHPNGGWTIHRAGLPSMWAERRIATPVGTYIIDVHPPVADRAIDLCWRAAARLDGLLVWEVTEPRHVLAEGVASVVRALDVIATLPAFTPGQARRRLSALTSGERTFLRHALGITSTAGFPDLIEAIIYKVTGWRFS